jgi:hypothetical protein
VAFEMIEPSLFGTAGLLAEESLGAEAVVALNAAGIVLSALVLVLVGASALASSIAMLQSGLFARWLGWFGVLVGALTIAAGGVATAGSDATGTVADLITALTGPAFVAFIIWLIVTSVVLIRAAPQRSCAAAARRRPARRVLQSRASARRATRLSRARGSGVGRAPGHRRRPRRERDPSRAARLARAGGALDPERPRL